MGEMVGIRTYTKYILRAREDMHMGVVWWLEAGARRYCIAGWWRRDLVCMGVLKSR